MTSSSVDEMLLPGRIHISEIAVAAEWLADQNPVTFSDLIKLSYEDKTKISKNHRYRRICLSVCALLDMRESKPIGEPAQLGLSEGRARVIVRPGQVIGYLSCEDIEEELRRETLSPAFRWSRNSNR